jgi:hypothetical protein
VIRGSTGRGAGLQHALPRRSALPELARESDCHQRETFPLGELVSLFPAVVAGLQRVR